MRLALVLLCAAALPAQSNPGAVRWGANRYVEYIVGNAPVILSMGHGGYLKPTTVKNRTYGVTTQDARTQEVGREIAAKFQQAFGLHPHVVVSHLHRIKLDPNRDIVEAAQGDKTAEQAWRDFHGFLAAARTTVTTQWGKGLYLDIHGHAHANNWVEFGYLLTRSDLNKSNSTLNGTAYIDKSCLRAVARRNSSVQFTEILRGLTSLGGELQARGIRGVPSPQHPGPGTASYFSGGYNSRRWGSQGGGSVDAIQIELPASMRRDLTGRGKFTSALVASLDPFLKRYWGLDLHAGARLTVRATQPVATETGEWGEFEVRRSGGTGSALSVALRFGGTATAGLDYPRLASTVTIPSGAAAVTLRVRPSQDTAREGTETVVLTVLPGRTGTPRVGVPRQATIRLLDDETDPSLAGHWRCDDTSGTRARDASGRGRHGLLRGGPARVTGAVSGAFGFDERDDRVVIPDFDYAAGRELTLAFWFRAPSSAQSSTQYFFSHGSVLAANSLNVYRFESSGLLRTWLRCKTDSNSSVLLDVQTDFMDNRWHHYCLTVEPGFEFASVWIDGVRRAHGRIGGDSLNPSGSLFVGARQDLSGSRFLRGAVDDVILHSRYFAPAQVVALFRGGVGSSRPFGTSCGAAEHVVAGSPRAGQGVSFEVRRAGAARTGALYFGFSRSRIGGLSLPLDLRLLGAPGCFLWQDAAFRVPFSIGLGSGSVPLRVPADPGLRGLRIYTQGMVVDPAANRAGFTVTNGVATVLGG